MSKNQFLNAMTVVLVAVVIVNVIIITGAKMKDRLRHATDIFVYVHSGRSD